MSFTSNGLRALRTAVIPRKTLVAQAVNGTFSQQQRGIGVLSGLMTSFGRSLSATNPSTSAASAHSEPPVGSSPKPSMYELFIGTRNKQHNFWPTTQNSDHKPPTATTESRSNLDPAIGVEIQAEHIINPKHRPTDFNRAIPDNYTNVGHYATSTASMLAKFAAKPATHRAPVESIRPPINISEYSRPGEMGVSQAYRPVPKIFTKPKDVAYAKLSGLEKELGQQPPLRFTAAETVIRALGISDRVIIVSRRDNLESRERARTDVYKYQKEIIDTGRYSGGEVFKDGNSTTQYFDFYSTLNDDLFKSRSFIGLIVREKGHMQAHAGGEESISRSVIINGSLVDEGSPCDKYLAACGYKFIRKDGISLEQENEATSYEEKYFEEVYADNLADIKIDIDPLELLKVFKFVHDVQSLLTFKAAMEFAIENNLVFKLNSTDYQSFTDNIKRLSTMSWELPSAIRTDPRFKDLDTSFTDISKVREAAKEMSRLNQLIHQRTEEAHKPPEPGTAPSIKMS